MMILQLQAHMHIILIGPMKPTFISCIPRQSYRGFGPESGVGFQNSEKRKIPKKSKIPKVFEESPPSSENAPFHVAITSLLTSTTTTYAL